MSFYLTNGDLEEVLSDYTLKLKENFCLETETIPVTEALGRVTAKECFAKICSPNHNAAAMDGIAVITKKTKDASEFNPVHLTIEKDFIYVNTGNAINEPYDAVIMIEDVYKVSENEIKIISPAYEWQHIRPIGEDIVFGEMIICKNHKIRAVDIGALLAAAVTEVLVYKKIRIGIIPTGNEITDDFSNLEKGKILDSNSFMLKAMAEEENVVVNRISPVNDDLGLLQETIKKMVEENDLVTIIAGSSAGTKDFTKIVIEKLGEVFAHGLSIKPGKPTIFGFVNNKAVIGVPGYPCSAHLVFKEVVIKVIQSLQFLKEDGNEKTAEAFLSKRLVSSMKHKEFVHVKLGKVFDKTIATPLNRGSGITTTLVKSDGVLEIPKNFEGFEASDKVTIKLNKSLSKIENTIVSIGSHDLIMDILSNIMYKKHGILISSSNVGSFGGIMAIKRNETHIAPIHLMDEETGIYNKSYLEKYLKDYELIKCVKRLQGFAVLKSNPKNIKSFDDIKDKDISFVNRQKGSGTRILTDYLLKQNNIDKDAIKGYERELTTHMAVAASVSSKASDVGVCVYSAAKALELDFVEIGYEEYDFAILKPLINDHKIELLLEELKGEEFKNILLDLGGYELW